MLPADRINRLLDDMTSEMHKQTEQHRHHRWIGRLLGTAFLLAATLFATGCVEVGLPADGDQTHGTFVPIFNMHNTIDFHDQESQRFVPELPEPKPGAADGMRYAPPETVARNRLSPGTMSADRLNAMNNPVPLDKQSLDHGKTAYNTTCISCHGREGKGNGPVADKWQGPNIPSLVSDASRNYSDGELYQIISHGKGTMWSYKSQLRPMERWAVVHWIRVLQRAHHPEPWDDVAGGQQANVN